jgi:hypothetical protein
MKIICIGRNYLDHAKELGNKIPTSPLFFLKPDTAIQPKGHPFFIPDFSNNIHFEVELVLKISKNGKNIDEKFAHKYYDKIIGPSGGLIFDEPTVDRMMVDEVFRIEMATKVGQIINKSNQIVTQATKLWELGFSDKQRFKNFDALVDHLSKFDELGYDAISDPEYEAGVFTDVVTQIATDPSMVPPASPTEDLSKKTYWEQHRRNQKIIKETKAIDNPEPVNPDQLNLDDLFPTKHRD